MNPAASETIRKISGLLHLAERARFLVFGSNLVLSARTEKIALVLLSPDLAENSTKKITARFPGKVRLIEGGPGMLFNQPAVKVIAVTNQGLAGKIRELLNNLENSAE